jgi:4-amino-4-deoxy-L-arabinose transferase-like glycosyltransferase
MTWPEVAMGSAVLAFCAIVLVTLLRTKAISDPNTLRVAALVMIIAAVVIAFSVRGNNDAATALLALAGTALGFVIRDSVSNKPRD